MDNTESSLDELNPSELIESKINIQISKTESDGESRNNNG
jgi:hypothetical protein